MFCLGPDFLPYSRCFCTFHTLNLYTVSSICQVQLCQLCSMQKAARFPGKDNSAFSMTGYDCKVEGG